MMTQVEWYRTLQRCLVAVGLQPCHLIGLWPGIETYCEPRRAEGASPYAAAAELAARAEMCFRKERDVLLEIFR